MPFEAKILARTLKGEPVLVERLKVPESLSWEEAPKWGMRVDVQGLDPLRLGPMFQRYYLRSAASAFSHKEWCGTVDSQAADHPLRLDDDTATSVNVRPTRVPIDFELPRSVTRLAVTDAVTRHERVIDLSRIPEASPPGEPDLILRITGKRLRKRQR